MAAPPLIPRKDSGFFNATEASMVRSGPYKVQVDETSISMEMGIDPPMNRADAAAELRDLEKTGPPDDVIWADHRRKLRRVAGGF